MPIKDREKRREWQRNWQHKKVVEGVCPRCGNKRDREGRLCSNCLPKHNVATKRYHKRTVTATSHNSAEHVKRVDAELRQAIKDTMDEMDISVSLLASRLAMSTKRAEDLLEGRRSLTLKTLGKISYALNVRFWLGVELPHDNDDAEIKEAGQDGTAKADDEGGSPETPQE